MSFKANIRIDLTINKANYNINVGIPTAAPSDKSPYKFGIAQKTVEGKEDTQLLNVVVGSEGHFYVAVSPPEEILSLTDGVVNDLEVVVNDGDYDPATGKFPESKPPTKADK